MSPRRNGREQGLCPHPVRVAKRKGRLLCWPGEGQEVPFVIEQTCPVPTGRDTAVGRASPCPPRESHKAGPWKRDAALGADGMGEGPAAVKRPRKALGRGCSSRAMKDE